MTTLTMSLHPSDEMLSRLADESDIQRMGSRAGRHAARCDLCQATIATMRALGESARSMPLAALPDTLLARIVVAASTGMTRPVAHDSDFAPAAGGEAGTRRHWLTRKRGAVLAAAAAIVVAALVGPMWRRHTLAAAGPGLLTISPRYPRAGQVVGIRFMPAAAWAGGDTLWVGGIIDVRNQRDRGPRSSTVPVGTTLLRGNDGAYRGRLTLPPTALSGTISVVNRRPSLYYWGRIVAKTVLLTGDASGERPSLDAMEDAVLTDRNSMTANLLANAFARWAPGHPLRWLVSEPGRSTGVIDWLTYFSSAERRFASLTTRLNAQPNARAGELAGMAKLAYLIEEPEAAAQWTERLMNEHPDNPWALALRVQQLHEMELRGTPRDSIALLLPTLDTLYMRSGGRLAEMHILEHVVRNNGDSATIHRWSLRQARLGRSYPGEFRGRQELFRDAQLRDSVEAYARDVLSGTRDVDSRPAMLVRARAYSSLASVALARGRYADAVVLTDSARSDSCVWMGQDTRALALLALGDTVRALPFIAAFAKNELFFTADSARRMLGSHATRESWRHASDSVEAVRMQCVRDAS